MNNCKMFRIFLYLTESKHLRNSEENENLKYLGKGQSVSVTLKFKSCWVFFNSMTTGPTICIGPLDVLIFLCVLNEFIRNIHIFIFL